jgi:hypothetical protein
MKYSFTDIFSSAKEKKAPVVVLGGVDPNPDLLLKISSYSGIQWREAFSTQGLLRSLPGANLVILDRLIPISDTPLAVMEKAIEMSGVPVTNSDDFLQQPEEWLGRARLASAGQITYLPARQVNLVNWSGGVGKTTLAMAICKRFVERTGLPAALLELSMGGSAIHARISDSLPEFFAIATGKSQPEIWHGVSLYPMEGRSIDVLWGEDPQRVRQVLEDIRQKHTLFVVDCFPGHPLFPELSQPQPGMVTMVITSPRDDAILQACRLMEELADRRILVLNMAKRLADRAEIGVNVILPFNESWALSLDRRLADPLLERVYTGWTRRNR